jgi:hypothetical protein
MQLKIVFLLGGGCCYGTGQSGSWPGLCVGQRHCGLGPAHIAWIRQGGLGPLCRPTAPQFGRGFYYRPSSAAPPKKTRACLSQAPTKRGVCASLPAALLPVDTTHVAAVPITPTTAVEPPAAAASPTGVLEQQWTAANSTGTGIWQDQMESTWFFTYSEAGD